MKITVIAQTSIVDIPESTEGTSFAEFFYGDREALLNDADTLAHFAGRSCYQAWNMPNEATRTNKGYIGNILDQGHFSVLEHGSVTFYIEGVSRNLTHELIRHRHLSYSELSQRYVKMEDAKAVIPPVLRSTDEDDASLVGIYSLNSIMEAAKDGYIDVVNSLDRLNITGKKAREAARALLPGATETKIVVSGNHRAWRDMLHKRYSVHADAEICELAGLLLAELKRIAPATYQDFPETPFE